MKQPTPLPIDYLECARMDIHGNSVARDGTLFVRLDDVDAVIDMLKAERSRSRPISSPQQVDDPIRLNTQPEGCDCGDCQRFRKDECPYPGSNPTIYICNSFLMDVKAHDTAIHNATLTPISEVYEKFKHFDKIICDPNFLKDAHDDVNYPMLLTYEMWNAIKESLRTQIQENKE
jgi:hypothetical protein